MAAPEDSNSCPQIRSLEVKRAQSALTPVAALEMSKQLITIESFAANPVDFTLRLASRFHERIFGPKAEQQKALENDVFQGLVD